MKMLPFLLAAATSLLLPAAACQGCFSEVPPQPADGVYVISSTLPDESCFWMYLAELKPHEDMASLLRRAYEEQNVQLSKQYQRKWRDVVGADGKTSSEIDPAAPDVRERGLVLRHPAAPEAWRDVIIPSYRDNMMDVAGLRERYYNLVLSVRFSPEGIRARPGEGSCELARATAPARFWPWSEAEDFLAELPSMLFGDPKKVVEWHGMDRLSPPMLERLRSGRRMVVLCADKNMPIAPRWECLAKLVAIVGGQNVTYSQGECVFEGKEYEYRERLLLGYPEPPEAPRPAPRDTVRPEVDVQPVLELGGEE